MTRGTLVSSECPPLVLPTSWTIAAFSKNLSSYEWINYIGNIVTCKGWGGHCSLLRSRCIDLLNTCICGPVFSVNIYLPHES